jgi:hypothetical protein
MRTVLIATKMLRIGGKAWPGSAKYPTVVRGGEGFETKMLRKPLTREGEEGGGWEGGIAKEGVGTLKRRWFRRLGTRSGRGSKGGGKKEMRGAGGVLGEGEREGRGQHSPDTVGSRGRGRGSGSARVVGKVVVLVPSSARNVDHGTMVSSASCGCCCCCDEAP